MSSVRKGPCSFFSKIICCGRAAKRKRFLVEATENGDLKAIENISLQEFATDKTNEDKNITLYDIACNYKHQHILDHFYKKAASTKMIIINGGAPVEADFVEHKGDNEQSLAHILATAIVYNQHSVIDATLARVIDKDISLENFLNNRHYNGFTPLQLAAKAGHEEVANKLLEITNRNINVLSNERISALYYAASCGHDNVMKCLLDNKADIDIRCMNDNTPLIAAAGMGSLSTVKFLVEAKANMHLRDNNGHGVLIHAAARGHKDVVEYFLTRGLKDEPNQMGHTAQAVASQFKHSEIVELLKNYHSIRRAPGGPSF